MTECSKSDAFFTLKYSVAMVSLGSIINIIQLSKPFRYLYTHLLKTKFEIITHTHTHTSTSILLKKEYARNFRVVIDEKICIHTWKINRVFLNC